VHGESHLAHTAVGYSLVGQTFMLWLIVLNHGFPSQVRAGHKKIILGQVVLVFA
jgi:hypothetical protein